MPTEIVILSEAPVTTEAAVHAVAQVLPQAAFISYNDGEIGQFVDPTGASMLSLYRSRPVAVAREAAEAIHDPPARFSLWTDLTLPFGGPESGRQAARAIADAVGGTVHERR